MKKMFFFLLFCVLLMGSSFSVIAMNVETANSAEEVHCNDEEGSSSSEDDDGLNFQGEEAPYEDKRMRARLLFANRKAVDLILLEPTMDMDGDDRIVGRMYMYNGDNVKKIEQAGYVLVKKEEYDETAKKALEYDNRYKHGQADGYDDAISHQPFYKTHSGKIIIGAFVVTAAVVAPVAYYFGSKNK